MIRRAIFVIAGLLGLAVNLIALRFALSPAFHFDQTPGFDISMALILLAIALWCLYRAWRP
jgi:hypothetical protein